MCKLGARDHVIVVADALGMRGPIVVDGRCTPAPEHEKVPAVGARPRLGVGGSAPQRSRSQQGPSRRRRRRPDHDAGVRTVARRRSGAGVVFVFVDTCLRPRRGHLVAYRSRRVEAGSLPGLAQSALPQVQARRLSSSTRARTECTGKTRQPFDARCAAASARTRRRGSRVAVWSQQASECKRVLRDRGGVDGEGRGRSRCSPGPTPVDDERQSDRPEGPVNATSARGWSRRTRQLRSRDRVSELARGRCAGARSGTSGRASVVSRPRAGEQGGDLMEPWTGSLSIEATASATLCATVMNEAPSPRPAAREIHLVLVADGGAGLHLDAEPEGRASRNGDQPAMSGVAGRAGGDVDAEFLLGLAIADGETRPRQGRASRANYCRAHPDRDQGFVAQRVVGGGAGSRGLPSGEQDCAMRLRDRDEFLRRKRGRIPQLESRRHGLRLPPQLRSHIGSRSRMPWSSFSARASSATEPRAHRRR